MFPYEHITREGVLEALRTLEGERLQTPPLFSAKKIDGMRAYELARAGETTETVGVAHLDALVTGLLQGELDFADHVGRGPGRARRPRRSNCARPG